MAIFEEVARIGKSINTQTCSEIVKILYNNFQYSFIHMQSTARSCDLSDFRLDFNVAQMEHVMPH